MWPSGETSYTVYEDDGKYISNETEEAEGYGTIDHISYGDHVSTTYTSKVEGDKAILTAEVSKGNYEGYSSRRETTWIVNLSCRPEANSCVKWREKPGCKRSYRSEKTLRSRSRRRAKPGSSMMRLQDFGHTLQKRRQSF